MTVQYAAWPAFKADVVSPLIHKLRFAKLDVLRRLHGSRKSVDTPHGAITVYAPNAKCFMRARGVLTKEPETTAWIDGFKAGDVYWDIGANIGQFALYAGANRNLTVLAFEPSHESLATLSHSIVLNQMQVQAYCMGFNDKTTCSRFELKTTEAGFATGKIGAAARAYSQAVLAFAIDDFIEQLNPPFPNHIKIDTDGHETKILTGAKKTLADPRLRSVCIELGDGRSQEPVTILQNAGFELDRSSEKAKMNRIFRRQR
jgi:FkbM family methyltransferase